MCIYSCSCVVHNTFFHEQQYCFFSFSYFTVFRVSCLDMMSPTARTCFWFWQCVVLYISITFSSLLMVKCQSSDLAHSQLSLLMTHRSADPSRFVRKPLLPDHQEHHLQLQQVFATREQLFLLSKFYCETPPPKKKPHPKHRRDHGVCLSVCVCVKSSQLKMFLIEGI